MISVRILGAEMGKSRRTRSFMKIIQVFFFLVLLVCVLLIVICLTGTVSCIILFMVFDSKASVEYFARSVPLEEIAANDYNLSVSSYVEAKDNREVVDITELNAELKITVAKIDRLRAEIDAIVAEIEV